MRFFVLKSYTERTVAINLSYGPIFSSEFAFIHRDYDYYIFPNKSRALPLLYLEIVKEKEQAEQIYMQKKLTCSFQT